MNNNNNKKNRVNKKQNAGNPVSYNVQSGTSRRGSKVESGSDTFVSSIAGSVSFDSNGYAINPGLADRNLALSKEAAKYDQYEFEELSFRFVRSKAVTTTAGLIGLAMDPNPNSADPAALNRFNAYEYRKSDSVYAPLVLRIPRQALQGWKFVRCGPLGSDLSLYDVGRLIVATQDEADTSKLGFVEMHYRVRFRHFHLEPSTPIPYGMSLFNLGSSQTITSEAPTTLLSGEALVDGLGLSDGYNTGIFTLPCGQYVILVEIGFNLTVAEDYQAQVDFQKNSAAMSPQIITNISGTSTLTTENVQMTLMGYITSDGTDTYRSRITIAASTSTISLSADRCRVLFRALT
jgi:hypothetical protein